MNLPQDLEAEKAALGAMMLDTEALAVGVSCLSPSAFMGAGHAELFAVLTKMYREGAVVDLVTARNALMQAGQLESVGGVDYLVDLSQSVPSAAGIENYCDILLNHQQRRDMLALAGEMTRRAADLTADPMTVAAECRQRLEAVGSGNVRHATQIVPVAASHLGPGEDPDWILRGYIARGHSTLMTSLWKCGKTTWLAHLLAAASQGGDVGGEVVPCKVLVISEETGALWAARRDALAIGDNVHFILRPFKGRPDWQGWDGFVDHLAGLVAKHTYALVVVDPLANLLPVRDENDAASMLSALMPLGRITEADAALLLLHHPRKGDGGEGQAARGSGALPGFVDVLVEMRRCTSERSDTRRVLTAYSRFDSTPAEQVLELTEGGYHSCGTKADAVKSDRMGALTDLLPSEAPGLTAEEVRDLWPDEGVQGIPRPGKRTLENDLKAGADLGRWHMTGVGRKGDPFRFYVDSVLASTLSVRESNPATFAQTGTPIERGRARMESADAPVNSIRAATPSKGVGLARIPVGGPDGAPAEQAVAVDGGIDRFMGAPAEAIDVNPLPETDVERAERWRREALPQGVTLAPRGSVS